MANTTNLNLTKLTGTEKQKSFPSTYNDNMDAIDGAFGADFGVSGKPSVNTELNSLGDGLAILANGNTHAAITSGQFVYVRGHSTLADGLYVATSNIAANATLSGSNLTADTAGGLNALNSKITAINSKTVVLPWGTYGENTHQLNNAVAVGKTVKIMAGANGRYVQYFTISGFGDSEQVAFMTDSGIIIVSLTDSTHIYIRGAGLTNNSVRIVYVLDGLVL